MKAAIVCGPRDGTGQQIVNQALDCAVGEWFSGLPRFDYLVVGSDRGTDLEAWFWAMRREIPCLICPAKWLTGSVRGPAEGPIRNRFQYRWVRPVVTLGFMGGTGTKDMMSVSCLGRTPTYWWSPFDNIWVRDERSE